MRTQLWYLATPYSNYHLGKDEEFRRASVIASNLLSNGVHVFSPIAHTHPIALYGSLPTSWEFWQSFDKAFISVCCGAIVTKMFGWQQSAGVNGEINEFAAASKPIIYMSEYGPTASDLRRIAQYA